MIFKSRKDVLFYLLSFSIVGFFIGFVLFRVFSQGIENYYFMWNDILMLLIAGLLLWVGLGTKYELTQTELKYRSDPLRGKIEIEKIQEIIKGKTLWAGLKPATARNGLIIKYEKYYEIYISPKTNDSFIKTILEINDKIRITTDKKA